VKTQLRDPIADGRPDAFDVPRLRFWGDRKPPKNRVDMFSTTVRDAAAGDGAAAGAAAGSSGKTATLRIYGPIDSWGGWWGISAADVAGALDTLPDDIDEIRVRINSPGGEVWEGLTILNMLRAHNTRTVAVVDGLAASAASIIACGLDETVMSPGTQFMIHDASGFAFGPEATMLKAGSWLGSISNAIAEVYAEQAGGTREQWRALMIAETWYTATETVQAKLADRVGVVKDEGEAATAGETSPEDAGDDTEVEDRFDLSIYNYAGRSHAPAPKQPAASAAGSTSPAAAALRDTSQEGAAAVFSDEQLTTLRQKLGVSADANADAVIGALDEALAERADPTNAAPGTVNVDAGTFAQMREDAAAGREARNAQLAQERENLVSDAVKDGRIPTASKQHWLTLLENDKDGAGATLAGLAKGLIPVDEVGHADPADDKSLVDVYDEMFPEHKKQEA
jgi:ATP-dependent protease ClpP protease subunit